MNDRPDPSANVTVERMTYWDLEQVTQIERTSFRHPWAPGGFRAEMERKPSVCLVARDGDQVLGYLVFWLLPPEIHILNIAVRADSRRLGLAGKLLEKMMEIGREWGVEEVWLEVRPSNRAALELYRSLGFETTGRRKNYYAEDNEDAILMTLFV